VRNFQYFPVLKGRNGEYGALEMLSPELKGFLCPVIEIPPVTWNHEGNAPAKTIDQHLQKVGVNVERAWGRTQPIFVDLTWIENGQRMADGTHPAIYLFRALRTRGVQALPVTGLVRDQEYQRAYRDVVQQDGRGVALRLQREDLAESDDLAIQVANLLSYFGTPQREADLILDLRSVDGSSQIEDVVSMIDALPKLDQWRSFALCGTAFPVNLMGIPPSARSSLPRTEWALWRELVSTRSLARNPNFGDYAIASPEPSEVDPRIMRPSASIRYTTEENWLILKGQNLRNHGFTQFHDVSRMLVSASEYSGPNLSWGDRYISECARNRVGTGNLTTWRKVGTSHHLAYVLRQLANLSEV
jgi:hypothetical protein